MPEEIVDISDVEEVEAASHTDASAAEASAPEVPAVQPQATEVVDEGVPLSEPTHPRSPAAPAEPPKVHRDPPLPLRPAEPVDAPPASVSPSTAPAAPSRRGPATLLPRRPRVTKAPAALVGKDRARHVIETCEKALASSRSNRGRADADLVARLHYEIGRQCEHPLGDLQRAAEEYHKALEQRPEQLLSIRGARRVALRQSNPSAALPFFDAEIRLTTKPRRRVDLLLEKADCLGRLGRDAEIHKTLTTAAELLPEAPDAQWALIVAERRSGNLAAVEGPLAHLAEAASVDAPYRAVLLALRARIMDSVRKDTRGAIEVYRSALATDPRSPGVIAALERLYYQEGRFNDLAEICTLEAEQATEPIRRGLAYQRLGRVLFDRLRRVEDGITAFERAHAELPADLTVLEELSLAYERAGRHQELAHTLERYYALLTDSEARMGIAHRIGVLYDEQLGDEPKAIAWYTRELERDPAHPDSLAALAALYAKRGEWRALVAMRFAEAETCQDGPRRASVFTEVASIMERYLGDPEEAAKLYARALVAQPGYPPAFLSLDRILSQAGRHRELIELYERASEQAGDAETRVAYLFKVGRLYEDALGDAEAAFAVYERIPGKGAAQIEALHAMQRAAERAGLAEQLVRSLEQEASSTKDLPRRLGLLHRAAQVTAMDLGDMDAAVSRWRSLLEIDGKYEPALVELASSLRKTGRWEEWLAVERRLLAVTPPGPGRVSIHFAMATVLDGKLARRGDAISSYREVLSANPLHHLAHLGLERDLALEERWAELVEIYEKTASRPDADPATVARRLTRAGEILEHRLGKLDLALAAYDKAVVAQSEYRPARDGRLRLLAQGRSYQALADAWATESEANPESAEGLMALFAEAEVRRDELEQPERACQLLERVLKVVPNHLAALVALEMLYAGLGSWEPLAAVLNTEVSVLSDPTARAAALMRLANVLRRVGTIDQVMRTLASVLESEPHNVEVLEQLEALALESNDASLLAQVDARVAGLVDDPRVAASYQTRLAEALEDAGDAAALEMYAAALGRDDQDVAAARGLGRLAALAGDAARLSAAAEHELGTTRDLDAAVEWLLMASDLEEAAGDLPGAIEHASRALTTHPEHHWAPERLTELRLARGEVDELVHALSQAANQARDRHKAAMLWVRVARLLADTKNDVPGAIVALNRVVHSLADNALAWLELAGLYERDGQFAAAVERYKKVLDTEHSDEQMLTARLAIGTLLAQRLGQPVQALEHLEAVLAINPREPSALTALLDIRIQRGEADAAAELAAHLVESSTSSEEKAEALLSVARIERQRGRADAAVRAYLQAVSVAGVEGPAASELVEILTQKRRANQPADWPGYAAALQQYLEQSSASITAVARTAVELGRVLDRELNQSEQAAQVIESALARAPNDVALLGELGGLLERMGSWAPAIDAYRRVLAIDVTRVDAFRGIVRALERLQKPDEAGLSLAPLVVLGAATDVEASAVVGRAPSSFPTVPRCIDSEVLEALGCPSLTDPLGTLLSAMADGLDRAEGPDLDRFGLSQRDRIGSRSGFPLRIVAERAAAACGVDEFDLYVASSGTTTVELPGGDPPAVVAPAMLLQVPESAQLFALTRVFAPIGRRWHAVERYDGTTLAMWISAALRLADPSYASGTPEDEAIGALSRRLAKALPWGRRGRVEEAAQSCLANGRIQAVELAQRTRLSAARAASLLANDLVATVSWLRRAEGDLSGRPEPLVSQGVALVQELVRSWVSEAAFQVRPRLGIG